MNWERRVFVILLSLFGCVGVLAAETGDRPGPSGSSQLPAAAAPYLQPSGQRDASQALSRAACDYAVWNNGYGDSVYALYSSQLDVAYPFDSQVADDFEFFPGEEDCDGIPIEDVHWVGGYWNSGPGTPAEFKVIFYADAGSSPTGGPNNPTATAIAVYSYTLAMVNQTAQGSNGYYDYSVTLSPAFVADPNTTYWIGIQATMNFPPQWGWAGHQATTPQLLTAVRGFPLLNVAYWETIGPQVEMNYCLTLSTAPTGACCWDEGQTPPGAPFCQDGFLEFFCTNQGGRFSMLHQCTAGGPLCEIEPPCGEATGACCKPDGTCTQVKASQCLPETGLWLGWLTLCDACPCVLSPACPPGGVLESEVCGQHTNDGCSYGVPYQFQSIACGQIVCGSIYADSYYNPSRDQDWWKLVLTQAQTVTFTVRSEFPMFMGFAYFYPDGDPNCSNYMGYIGPYQATMDNDENCSGLSVSRRCDPGTYYVLVLPWAGDGYPCTPGTYNNYIGTLTCAAPASECDANALYSNQPTALWDYDAAFCPSQLTAHRHSQSADDFVLAGTGTIPVGYVKWAGAYWAADAGEPTAFKVYFYNDAGGMPTRDPNDPNCGDPSVGAMGEYYITLANVNERAISAGHGGGLFAYSAGLSPPMRLTAGTRYWIGIQAVMDLPAQWGWARHYSPVIGYPSVCGDSRCPGLALDDPVYGWPHQPYWTPTNGDLNFCLYGATLGACCYPNGECEFLTEADCRGGVWQGAFTSCDPNPCKGNGCYVHTNAGCDDPNCEQSVCAYDPYCCSVMWDALCAAEAGGDPNCACGAGDAMTCPADTVVGQPPSDPNLWFPFVVSDAGAGCKVYENLTIPESEVGQVCDLHWWGFELRYSGGWLECDEDPMQFEIAFYQDNAGLPGAQVCGLMFVTPVRTKTGHMHGDKELIRYDVSLDSCCTLRTGWVSIQGVGEPNDCWFIWAGSPTGDQTSLQRCGGDYVPLGHDRALCVTNAPPIYGACCIDGAESGPLCLDNVTMRECLAIPGARFSIGHQCSPGGPLPQISPPCGALLGACCRPDCTCALTVRADCAESGDHWLGAGTTCNQCPCCLNCSAGSVAEGEACGSDTNGGCDSMPHTFMDVQCGDVICGNIWADGGARDTDWYRITLADATTLTWTVRAEFPLSIRIMTGDCGDPSVLAGAIAPACTDAVAQAALVPGTYYLWVSTDSVLSGYACGAGPGADGQWTYYASLTYRNHCSGAIWSNGLYEEGLWSSQLSGLPNPLVSQTADDFRLASASPIREVCWLGEYWNGGTPPFQPAFRLIFYSDAGGQPGDPNDPNATAAIYDVGYSSVHETDQGDGLYYYSACLAPTFRADANTPYWLVVQAVINFPPQWGWAGHAHFDPNRAVQCYPEAGVACWTPVEADMAFCLVPGCTLPADVNGDGVVDNFDINPFVYCLTHPREEFQAAYPNGRYWCADVNCDCVVDNFDINAFVKCLTHQSECVPCP